MLIYACLVSGKEKPLLSCNEGPSEGVIRVPYERLSADALESIIEDFVSREGTDYGMEEFSFEDKKSQVMTQIRKGKVIILFDPYAESCHLVLADQLPPGL